VSELELSDFEPSVLEVSDLELSELALVSPESVPLFAGVEVVDSAGVLLSRGGVVTFTFTRGCGGFTITGGGVDGTCTFTVGGVEVVRVVLVVVVLEAGVAETLFAVDAVVFGALLLLKYQIPSPMSAARIQNAIR